LEEQSALKQKVGRLQQVKGVSFITAVSCVALCPELGSLSRRQTAALVGVAPYDDDSGARKGGRHIAGGRPKLRRALYMAAISAIRSNPILRRFLPATASAQQTTQRALVAVIRKLAILLNHLLQNPSFLPAS
jgi:transposase